MHFPIILMTAPANVISQVQFTLTVALFDVLEIFFDWREVKQLQFEDDDEEKLVKAGVPFQLQNCGY